MRHIKLLALTLSIALQIAPSFPAYCQSVVLPQGDLTPQARPSDMPPGNTNSLSPPAQGQNAAKSKSSPTFNGSLQGKVVKSLVSLSQVQRDQSTLNSDLTKLSKFLEDSMLDVSYPVIIPAVSDGPVTLATPKFAIYSGHYYEQRNRYVDSSIHGIGLLVQLLSSEIEGLEVPEESIQPLAPLMNEVNSTMNGLVTDYNGINQELSPQKMDAEAISAKVLDMQRDLSVANQDLKAMFRIVNIKNASPDTVAALVDLKIMDNDASWLGTCAQLLHDTVKRLNPLAAFVYDAQLQGWLVMGPTAKQYRDITRQPYENIPTKLLNERMSDLASYIKALQNDVQNFKTPSDKQATVTPMLAQLNDLATDANTRYNNLKTIMSASHNTQQVNEAGEQSEAIQKDMEQADKIEHDISNALAGDSSII